MLVLGVDTSESPGSVALLDGAGLAVERALPEPLRHAECLLPTIEGVLEDSGRVTRDIERICVNLGPGSFTGLRIGLATAKGMSQAGRIELVGVDGTVAYRAQVAAVRRVCVAISSRRDLVYARWFSETQARTDTAMMHVAELVERLRAERQPICVVGSAARRVVEQLGAGTPASVGPEEALRPSALAVAKLGAPLRAAPMRELEPMYVEPILA